LVLPGPGDSFAESGFGTAIEKDFIEEFEI
jgi:hypothetical protein